MEMLTIVGHVGPLRRGQLLAGDVARLLSGRKHGRVFLERVLTRLSPGTVCRDARGDGAAPRHSLRFRVEIIVIPAVGVAGSGYAQKLGYDASADTVGSDCTIRTRRAAWPETARGPASRADAVAAPTKRGGGGQGSAVGPRAPQPRRSPRDTSRRPQPLRARARASRRRRRDVLTHRAGPGPSPPPRPLSAPIARARGTHARRSSRPLCAAVDRGPRGRHLGARCRARGAARALPRDMSALAPRSARAQAFVPAMLTRPERPLLRILRTTSTRARLTRPWLHSELVPCLPVYAGPFRRWQAL